MLCDFLKSCSVPSKAPRQVHQGSPSTRVIQKETRAHLNPLSARPSRSETGSSRVHLLLSMSDSSSCDVVAKSSRAPDPRSTDSLAAYIGTGFAQKPMKNIVVHPQKHVLFAGEKKLVLRVCGAGWSRNPIGHSGIP